MTLPAKRIHDAADQLCIEACSWKTEQRLCGVGLAPLEIVTFDSGHLLTLTEGYHHAIVHECRIQVLLCTDMMHNSVMMYQHSPA